MKMDIWLEEMVKDIESKKEKPTETPEVKLSESDMNTLADIMIKKMSSENFDVESKDDKPDNDKPPTENKDGEIPIE